MKILGWFIVACFALALGCTVMIVAQYLGAPEQVRSFLIACVGAVATFAGPRALDMVAKVAPAR